MMWCNNYTPPVVQDYKVHVSEPYDINCAIPLNLAALENERIKLTPFVPQLHAEPFLKQVTKHPQLFRYLSFPVPASLEDVSRLLQHKFETRPGNVFFAIHDKTRPSEAFGETVSGGGSFAGTIALMDTSIPDLSTEVGYVIIFPDYQRTHVLSNAAGLLIQYCLNLASDAAVPGIGYRRVQWMANSENVRSIQAAERLGFRVEGTVRWHYVLPEGSAGLKPREGDPAGEKRSGRHTVMLSICWDDWISGAKENLKVIMDRR